MSRYGNKKVEIDGIVFDSQMEGEFYKLLKSSDDVLLFELQPRFLLQEAFRKNGKAVRKIEYVADFKVVYKDGTTETIDVKGMMTDTFKLKKKMFDFRYRDEELILLRYTKKNGWVKI